MDETTKILIGTISGFAIAFLSEPIKLYFQNKFDVVKMQRALYYEIYNNYVILLTFLNTFKDTNSQVALNSFKSGAKHAIRVECYKHFISNDVRLFYQLDEASAINLMYSHIYSLIDYINPDKNTTNDIRDLVKLYTDIVKEAITRNTLNKRVLNKVVGKEIAKIIKTE